MGLSNYFYHDKPILGIDLSATSLKIMQIAHGTPKPKVVGYGVTHFEQGAVVDGVILKPQVVINAINGLLGKGITGSTTTKRACLTIPTTRAFIRSMSLPHVAAKDLSAAVELEVEQYIPRPIAELYVDYSVIRQTDKLIELLMVAVPKKIVDSYFLLAAPLNLEIVAIEPTILAVSRLFAVLEHTNIPTILIDFGSVSTDVIVYDRALITADSVVGGGDNFTALIGKRLGIQPQEAHFIKTNYGLLKSLKQKDIISALEPFMEELTKEVKRIIRYYEERTTGNKTIVQIVTVGGGTNMPGLSEYLTNALRLPVRSFAPWLKLDFQGLQVPADAEQPIYATVAGSALLNPKELFR